MPSSKMESDVYMLGASVEDRVLGYLDTRLIVFMKGYDRNREFQVVGQFSQPDGFFHSQCQCHILSFCAAVEVATIFCLVDSQDRGPPQHMNMYPVVDLRVSGQRA